MKKGMDRLAIEVLCRMDISVVRTPSGLDYFVNGIKTGPGALQCFRWTKIPERFIMDQLVDELVSYISEDKIHLQSRRQTMGAIVSKRKLTELVENEETPGDHERKYERERKRGKGTDPLEEEAKLPVRPGSPSPPVPPAPYGHPASPRPDRQAVSSNSKGKGKQEWKDPYLLTDDEGSDDISDTSSVEKRKEHHRAIRQTDRNARHKAKIARGKHLQPPPPRIHPCRELHGKWMDFLVNTRSQADELFHAATIQNDEYAFRWIMYLNTNFQQPHVAAQPRPVGANYLLKRFPSIIPRHPMYRRMKQSLQTYMPPRNDGSRRIEAAPSQPGPSRQF